MTPYKNEVDPLNLREAKFRSPHPDVVYRLKIKGTPKQFAYFFQPPNNETSWFVRPISNCTGGYMGCYATLRDARISASRQRISQYTVYMIHVGDMDSDVPYFPPQLVFERE